MDRAEYLGRITVLESLQVPPNPFKPVGSRQIPVEIIGRAAL